MFRAELNARLFSMAKQEKKKDTEEQIDLSIKKYEIPSQNRLKRDRSNWNIHDLFQSSLKKSGTEALLDFANETSPGVMSPSTLVRSHMGRASSQPNLSTKPNPPSHYHRSSSALFIGLMQKKLEDKTVEVAACEPVAARVRVRY